MRYPFYVDWFVRKKNVHHFSLKYGFIDRETTAMSIDIHMFSITIVPKRTICYFNRKDQFHRIGILYEGYILI